jgi:putative membrane protein
MYASSFTGLPAFAAYFTAAALLCVLFVAAYTWATPNPEIAMIRQGNCAAALSVGMSLLGFSLPLASAIFHSANLIDCVIWGCVALLVQMLAYVLARWAHPGLCEGIANDNASAGVFVGCISLTAGVLSAASMTY